MNLRPLNNSFIFTFFADSAQGRFIERNRGNIILTNQDISTQGKFARWAKVEAVGKDVDGFGVGDIVLIEALQWTLELKWDEKSYWKSDSSKVIAIGDNESVTYTYG